MPGPCGAFPLKYWCEQHCRIKGPVFPEHSGHFAGRPQWLGFDTHLCLVSLNQVTFSLTIRSFVNFTAKSRSRVLKCRVTFPCLSIRSWHFPASLLKAPFPINIQAPQNGVKTHLFFITNHCNKIKVSLSKDENYANQICTLN